MPPSWWLRLVGESEPEPSDDFVEAAHQADDREDRIDALELRVRIIEQRLRQLDAPPRNRKPA